MAGERRATARDFVRYGVFAILAGAAFGFFIGGMELRFRPLAVGGIIGLCCYTAAFAADHLFRRWLEARPEQWWRRAIVYFVASQFGWPVGLYLGLLLFHGLWPWETRLRAPWIVVIGISAIGTLAGVAASAYERLKARLRASIEELKEREFADKELQLARELQARMLPPQLIEADGYRISSRNFAARYVAGDFYDVFQYADGAIGVAVADVAGKGMPASLLMASVKAVLPLLASTRTIAAAMAALNEKLVGDLAKREFVAMSLARFEPGTGTIELANAGLPDPYVVRADGSVTAIEVPGPRLPLGLRRAIPYEKREISLARGEALMLFSDGLPEAATADGEQLGYERLAEIVRASGMDVDAILQRIHAVEAGPRDDDQTVVMIQRV